MGDLENIPGLLAGLRQDIIERRIRSGFERLEAQRALIETLDPAAPNAAQLLWRLAQWIDAGWGDEALLVSILQRLPRSVRSSLSLHDYAALRMAEGRISMSHEDMDEAIAHFQVVLTISPDLSDPEISAIAHFWTARCQRKRGEYERAMTHTLTARAIAEECGCERMASVMSVLESWLHFQKGRHKESLRILGETEAILGGTDDHVVLGNIQSTYGRIYRQDTRYDRSLHHFSLAIEEYRKVDPRHPNLARTLANMAYVERLVALELRKKIEADVARKKARPGTEAGSSAAYRSEYSRLLAVAFAHLDEAAAIYEVHPNHRGAGTVHLNRGLLHVDNGELDMAEQEASLAYALGHEKEDAILMARARILQCIVENSKLEEGIEGDPRSHAQAALEYIKDATELAQHTENRRLLARVHTWRGLTLSNEFFCEHDAAIEAMNTASGYLDHSLHDTAWEDLRTLKSRVLKAHSVNETLLAWSQGAVGDRTFREIAEQFAEIVIPKVWEAEGRRVARVATRLSISPKKVRRALGRAGLLRKDTRAPHP